MMYLLDDLLAKMGAPDLKEKGRLEWFYFDPVRQDIGGAAEIRFEAGGERLGSMSSIAAGAVPPANPAPARGLVAGFPAAGGGMAMRHVEGARRVVDA